MKNPVNLWESVPQKRRKVIEWGIVILVFTGIYILGRFGPLN